MGDPPATRAISILKNPENFFKPTAAERMFSDPESWDEKEIQNAPHFSYFVSILVRKKTTECLTAIEGLDATFNEVSMRSQGAMDTWWAELQNESRAFKVHLNQEHEKTSGTPIEHLMEYLRNVQKLDASIFSKTKEERDFLAPLLNPIEFDIRKLSRKVTRITSALKNQVTALETAANNLMTAWEPEPGVATINPVIAEWDSLIYGAEDDDQKPMPSTPRLSSIERSIATGWSRVRNLIRRKSFTTPSANTSDADIPNASVLSIKSGHMVPRVESTDASIIPEEVQQSSGLSNVSVVSSAQILNTVEWPNPIPVGPSKEETSIAQETAKSVSDTESQTNPSSDAESRTDPSSDAETQTDAPCHSETQTDDPLTARVSNANSKSNWLSNSKEDFNFSSDSDSELCMYEDHSTRRAEPLSALSIFADKFALKLETEAIEKSTNISDPTSFLVASTGHPKKFVHFREFNERPDFRTPLKEFAKNLHTMIEDVIEKCRFLELRFFQVELQPTWCEPQGKIQETEEVVENLKEVCEQLAHPALSSEIYDGDKADLSQSLQSMLQAANKCLHLMQDLNHVVNSERREFIALWKSFVSTSTSAHEIAIDIEKGHGQDHDQNQCTSEAIIT